VPGNEENMKRVSTRGYPCPFDFFNPVQSLVYPHKDSENNMILAANTSAGKTIAAELLVDSTLKRGQRVIYLSPLKALTKERYDDWQRRYENEALAIMTGDYVLSDEMQKQRRTSSIVLMTSEMMDSRTRKFHSEKNYWMKEVGLVIVDESHILSGSRGPAVETGIMRFTWLCPEARILFLSATMPNVDSLGEWLTSLNNKDTDVICSDWRPVELQMHYEEYEITLNEWEYEDYWANEYTKQSLAADLVMAKPDEKFLVFVHSKKTGKSILKILQNRGIETAFHNAELAMEERLTIEESFRDRENGTRVLVSTSTNAWGVNLPARNVVIVGVHRGLNEVDQVDLIQMAGRAGRYGIDDEGHVYAIIPQESKERWMEEFNNPKPVISVLNNHHILAFHVLAEIQTKVIQTETDLFRWYQRSLAYRQGLKPFSESNAKELFSDLARIGMIKRVGSVLKVTKLGSVSAIMYYSPYDVYSWYKNFSFIFDNNIDLDDVLIAWAVGSVPSYESDYVPTELKDLVIQWIDELENRGLHAHESSVIAVAAVHNCLTRIKGKDQVANTMSKLRCDAERIATAIGMVDSNFAKWDKSIFCGTLALRIKRGITQDAAWKKVQSEKKSQVKDTIVNTKVGAKARNAVKAKGKKGAVPREERGYIMGDCINGEKTCSFDSGDKHGGPKTKMEGLIASQAHEGFTPTLEKGNKYIKLEACPSCSKKTMVTFYSGDQERFACPCGHSEVINEDNEDYHSTDYEDYDPDERYDVPPDYMDDCPEGVDPDTYAGFYTGG